MAKIKFTDDYYVDGDVFVRNSIWDYIDKHEEFIPKNCDNNCNRFALVYRININDHIYSIPEDYIVEIDNIINKDYTEGEWDVFITKDAMVVDGNYVKSWEEANAINKPVKDVTDQADYDGRWRELNKRIKERWGNGGFEES